jgi:hypothetical protein
MNQPVGMRLRLQFNLQFFDARNILRNANCILLHPSQSDGFGNLRSTFVLTYVRVCMS